MSECYFSIGDRVRVAIQRPDRYAPGCAESLDCRVGTIEEKSYNSFASISGSGPALLVRFDEPAPPWHPNQLPQVAFWFDSSELVKLRTPPTIRNEQ